MKQLLLDPVDGDGLDIHTRNVSHRCDRIGLPRPRNLRNLRAQLEARSSLQLTELVTVIPTESSDTTTHPSPLSRERVGAAGEVPRRLV